MIVVTYLITKLFKQRKHEETKESLLAFVESFNVFVDEHRGLRDFIQLFNDRLTMEFLNNQLGLVDVIVIRHQRIPNICRVYQYSSSLILLLLRLDISEIKTINLIDQLEVIFIVSVDNPYYDSLFDLFQLLSRKMFKYIGVILVQDFQ